MRALQYIVVIGLIQGCVLEKAKKKTPVEEQKAEAPKPEVTLTADSAQIYLSDPVTLNWDSKNVASCVLYINKEEAPGELTLAGTNTYSPNTDTDYEVVCKSSDGREARSKLTVKVLGPTEEFLSFASKDEANGFLDLAAIPGELCKSKTCYWADLESKFFESIAEGRYLAKEAFYAELNSQAPAQKAITVKNRAIAAKLQDSLVYGSEDSLADLKLGTTCETAFAGMKEAEVVAGATLDGQIEDSEESMNGVLLPGAIVITKAKFSGQMLKDTIKTGSDIKATYEISEVTADLKAQFSDFEKASASFKAPTTGIGQ